MDALQDQFDENRLEEYDDEDEEDDEGIPQDEEEDDDDDEEEDDMADANVGGSFSNVAQGLNGHNRDLMIKYWQDTINSIEHDDHKFKIHQLPLARIKKVMKADEDVRMISAEAPILFAKGCDIFITELTMRAWVHAEENKRRTLQRSDIANALQKSDMFDFLIDIVPREEASSSSTRRQRQQQEEQPEETNPPQHQQTDLNNGQPQMSQATTATMDSHPIHQNTLPPIPALPQPNVPNTQRANEFSTVYQYGDLSNNNNNNGYRQY